MHVWVYVRVWIFVYGNAVWTCNFHVISQGIDLHNLPWLHPITHLCLTYFNIFHDLLFQLWSNFPPYSWTLRHFSKYIFSPIFIISRFVFILFILCMLVCSHILPCVRTCTMCSWVCNFSWVFYEVTKTCVIFFLDCAAVTAPQPLLNVWLAMLIVSESLCLSVICWTALNNCLQSAV